MPRTRPKTRETISKNLRVLLTRAGWSEAELSRKTSGAVSAKQVNNVMNGVHAPSIETADALARPFGLTGWQLMVPNLPDLLIGSHKIGELVSNYVASGDEGRELLDKMAAREAGRKGK